MENVAGKSISFTINCEPSPPEPRIGSGMILERGRERFVFSEEVYRSSDDIKSGAPRAYWTYRQRRSLFGKWSIPTPVSNYDCDARVSECNIRAMLLSGWTVIRPADEPRGEGK